MTFAQREMGQNDDHGTKKPIIYSSVKPLHNNPFFSVSRPESWNEDRVLAVSCRPALCSPVSPAATDFDFSRARDLSRREREMMMMMMTVEEGDQRFWVSEAPAPQVRRIHSQLLCQEPPSPLPTRCSRIYHLPARILWQFSVPRNSLTKAKTGELNKQRPAPSPSVCVLPRSRPNRELQRVAPIGICGGPETIARRRGRDAARVSARALRLFDVSRPAANALRRRVD